MENITKEYPLLVSLISGKQLKITRREAVYICSFFEITEFQNKGGFYVKNCFDTVTNKYWDAVGIFSLFYKPKEHGDTYLETVINIFGNTIVIDSIYDKKAFFYKEEWGDKETMTIEILGNLYQEKVK